MDGAPAALEVLVCFDGAILAAHQLLDGQTLRVGEGTEFPVEGLPAGGLTVAGLDESGAYVQFHGGALGEITVGEETRSLAEYIAAGKCPSLGDGVRRHDLADGTRAVIDLGPLTLHVKVAPPADRVPRMTRVDWRAHRFTVATASGAAFLLALAFCIPPDAAMASSDHLKLDEDLIHSHFVPKLPEVVKQSGKSKTADSSTSRMKGLEGTAGKRDSTRRGHLAIKGTSTEVKIAGGTDVAGIARSSGILLILGDKKGGVLGQILDPNETALGDAAEAFKGRLDGLENGEGGGIEGAGLIGTGPGGGCKGDNCTATIAFGDGFCPGGHCTGGPGSKWGPSGGKDPMIKRHVSHEPVVEIGKATVGCAPGAVNCLDKETIRRVIHSHMNEIRFCYERELNGAPDLEGKVAVSFLISTDGRVLSAVPKDVTIKGMGVPTCVANAVKRLAFPMPIGAPAAQVSYPFMFRHAGTAAAE